VDDVVQETITSAFESIGRFRWRSNSPLGDELPILGDLPYPKQTDGTLLAEDVVSRKKQLLPVVLGLLEG
jgi:hypothetical protein